VPARRCRARNHRHGDAITAETGKLIKIIDASTAHRVAPDWVYGFAELAPGQLDAIRNASRVSNPGC